jgi:eukaryotic-like serine/threonine-protein kinase
MDDFIDKLTAVGSGSVLNDRYEVLSLLGRGGMSTVYRVRDRNLEGQEIALKLLKTSLLEERTMRERFRREAIISRKLDHPNIVRVFDFDCTYSGEYFITMELVRGTTFSRMIRSKETRSSMDELIRLFRQILRGLSLAHSEGVIHRDLKPANILIAENNRVKVTDFGLARATGFDSSLSSTGECIGTPSYMSPEQIRGEDLDGRCDLYAFGILAYEAISGTVPFPGDTWYTVAEQHLRGTMPELPDTVPAWYRKLVSRCTAKSPADRFASANEVLEFIEYHSGVAESATFTLPQTVDKERRYAFALSFATVLLVTALLLVVGFTSEIWSR